MDDFLMQNILNDNIEDLEPPSRRTGNPLTELPEKQFIKLFRVNKRLFNYIVSLVEPYMRPKRISTDLAVNTRVSISVTKLSSFKYVRYSIKSKRLRKM